MTPARKRHPALARKIDQFAKPNRSALNLLIAEIHKTAKRRGHAADHLGNLVFSPTHARVTCGKCGMDADANTQPAPNGIDIGGPLVALNCGPWEGQ